eukprot:304901-Pelagomonas_calceolata.AAC.1
MKKKNYVGRGDSPCINEGKGDTLSMALAQKSCESPPPQNCNLKGADGDLEARQVLVQSFSSSRARSKR